MHWHYLCFVNFFPLFFSYFHLSSFTYLFLSSLIHTFSVLSLLISLSTESSQMIFEFFEVAFPLNHFSTCHIFLEVLSSAVHGSSFSLNFFFVCVSFPFIENGCFVSCNIPCLWSPSYYCHFPHSFLRNYNVM